MKRTLFSLLVLSLMLVAAGCQQNAYRQSLPDQDEMTLEQSIEIQEIEQNQNQKQALDEAVKSMDKAIEIDEELDASITVESLEE